jgi:hypothetical protein
MCDRDPREKSVRHESIPPRDRQTVPPKAVKHNGRWVSRQLLERLVRYRIGIVKISSRSPKLIEDPVRSEAGAHRRAHLAPRPANLQGEVEHAMGGVKPEIAFTNDYVDII